jgi:hypothetical protein
LKTFKRRNNGTYTFANFGILVVYQCAKGIFDNGLPIGLWNFYFIILELLLRYSQAFNTSTI